MLLEGRNQFRRHERAHDRSQINPGVYLAVDASFDFGLGVVASVRTHSLVGQGFHASILARSFFENAVMVLWASRSPGEWLRVLADGTAKDGKNLGDLAKVGKPYEWAEEKSRECEKLRQGTKCLPDIKTMLKQIEECDQRTESAFLSGNRAAFEYPAIYGFLSRSVHANPALLGTFCEAHKLVDMACLACAYSAFMLARGSRYVLGEGIGDLVTQMVILLIGYEGLLKLSKRQKLQGDLPQG
jgi:hypothetical protein